MIVDLEVVAMIVDLEVVAMIVDPEVVAMVAEAMNVRLDVFKSKSKTQAAAVDGVLKNVDGELRSVDGEPKTIVLCDMPEILWKMLENPDPPLHAKEMYEDRKLVEVSNVKESVPVEAEAGLIHVPQLLKVIHAYQHDVDQTVTRQ